MFRRGGHGLYLEGGAWVVFRRGGMGCTKEGCEGCV